MLNQHRSEGAACQSPLSSRAYRAAGGGERACNSGIAIYLEGEMLKIDCG